MSKLKDLFLNRKPVRALTVIRKSRDDIYSSIISKEIDTTYAHTVKIVSKMEDEGLVKSDKQGRKKILTLTDEGKDFADKFIELMNMMEGNKKITEKDIKNL